MTPTHVAIVACLVFAYALVSRPLADRSVSGPMVFVLAGLLLSALGLELTESETIGTGVEFLAEAALIVVLFSDATRIDLRVLRSQSQLPARLLGIGLPLTILVGAVLAWLVFPDLLIAEAFVLAAVLAPTDAALGQAVVTDARTPIRIRQGLNVESGLNDGLMAPIVAFSTALAGAEAGTLTDWLGFLGRQVGYGLGAGVIVGVLGGVLFQRFVERDWITGGVEQLGVMAVAVMAWSSAEAVGGNGFVAAFVAGVAFGGIARGHRESATEFAENEGSLLILLTFLLWSVQLVVPNLTELTPRIAIYVVLSLTLVRMVPVAISLVGTRLEPPTVAYLGWFGPRGLASIIFALYAVEELEGTAAASTILVIVTWTVLVSVVAHGLTAVPFARRYGFWFAAKSDDELAVMPESVPVEPMRTRVAHTVAGFRPHHR